MAMRNNWIVVIVGGMLLCLGCASTSQTRQFYTLRGLAPAADTAPAAETVPAPIAGGLGLGPIELPEFLAGNNIVSILGDQQIQKSQLHLWGGDLQKTISRTLATNLSQQLNFDDVWPFPWDTRHRPEKQISILVERLDGQLGKPVTLVAKWTLLDERGQTVIAVGRQRFTADPKDASYASYVGAINDLINQFSLTLETEIRRHWRSDSPALTH
jgi:uncharacterized lipoprotein YmbA